MASPTAATPTETPKPPPVFPPPFIEYHQDLQIGGPNHSFSNVCKCQNVLLHFTPAAPSAYYTLSPQKQTKPTLPGPASTPKKAGASPIKKDTPETGSKSSRKVCTTHSPSPFHPLQALPSLPQLTIPPPTMNNAVPLGLPCYRTHRQLQQSRKTLTNHPHPRTKKNLVCVDPHSPTPTLHGYLSSNITRSTHRSSMSRLPHNSLLHRLWRR